MTGLSAPASMSFEDGLDLVLDGLGRAAAR